MTLAVEPPCLFFLSNRSINPVVFFIHSLFIFLFCNSRRGAPFYRLFQHNLLRIGESGIVNQWFDDVIARRVKAKREAAALNPSIVVSKVRLARITSIKGKKENSARLERPRSIKEKETERRGR